MFSVQLGSGPSSNFVRFEYLDTGFKILGMRPTLGQVSGGTLVTFATDGIGDWSHAACFWDTTRTQGQVVSNSIVCPTPQSVHSADDTTVQARTVTIELGDLASASFAFDFMFHSDIQVFDSKYDLSLIHI